MRLKGRAWRSGVLSVVLFSACLCGDPRLAALPQIVIQDFSEVTCDGEIARLGIRAYGGFPPYRYRWEPEEGLSNPREPETWAQPGIDSYEVFVIDSLGHYVSQTIEVKRRPLPLAVIDVEGSEIPRDDNGEAVLCSGSLFTLSAESSSDADGQAVKSLQWELPGQKHDGARSSQLSEVKAIPGQKVRLKVRDDLGCEGSAETTLPVRALPKLSLELPPAGPHLCVGSTVELWASAQDAEGVDLVDFSWDLDGDPASIESKGPSSGPFSAFSGEVSLRVKDRFGCEQSLSQSLTAHEPPTAVISFDQGAATMCQGHTAAFHGLESRDAYGQAVSSWEWRIDDGVQAQVWQGQSPPPASLAGDLQLDLTVTDIWGCQGSTTQTVLSQAPPVVAIDVEQGEVNACAHSLLVLGARGQDVKGTELANFAWEVNGHPVAGDPVLTLNPSAETQVRLVGRDSLGCLGSAELELNPRPLPQAQIVFEEGDSQVCSGDRVALSATVSSSDSSPLVYSWEVNGQVVQESENPELEPFELNSDAIVRLRVSNAEGCEQSQSVALHARALPELKLSFDEGSAAVCQGTQIAASASGSRDVDGNEQLALVWEVWRGDELVLSANGELPPFTLDEDAQLHLRGVDSQGCSTEISQALTAHQPPEPRISFVTGHESSCQGALIQLDGSSSSTAGGDEVAEYRWEIGEEGTIFSSAAPDPFVAHQPTSARLTVIDENGCSAVAEQWVTPRDLPSVSIVFDEGDFQVCRGDVVSLSASASSPATPLTYSWEIDGQLVHESNSPELDAFALESDSTVQLRVSDAEGCVNSESVMLFARGLPDLKLSFDEGSAAVCQGAQLAVSASGSRDVDGNEALQLFWELWREGELVLSADDELPPFVLDDNAQLLLRGVDAQGCSSEITQSLTSLLPPEPRISFVSGHENSCQGALVQLDGSSSTTADGGPVAEYRWEIGEEGTVFTSSTPDAFLAHEPLSARLWVSDEMGCSATAEQHISPRALPTAAIVFEQGHPSVCQGDEVAVSAAGSLDADGQAPVNYEWDLNGDGTPDSFSLAPEAFVPQGSGSLNLKVSDSQGCFASTSMMLDPRKLPTPVLSFLKGRENPCEGDMVALGASDSFDADNQQVVSWGWDLTGSGQVEVTGPVTGEFLPSATATLWVSDSQGCTAQTSQAFSPRALPTPVLSFLSGDSQLCDGETAVLGAGNSVDADGQQVASYAWDLDGDGEDDHFEANSGSLTPNNGHTVRLTVRDHLECSASLSQSFGVRELPHPQYALVGKDFVCEGDPAQLDGSSSTAADGGPVSSWAWSLNGNPDVVDSTQAVTHAFTPQGEVSLTVSDGFCEARVTGGLPVGGPRELFDLGGNSSAHLKAAVDLILVVDNSGSMAPFIEATQRVINNNFAAHLEAHGLDYRVIVISRHGSSSNERICIRSPLSGTNCNPVPARPALSSRFFHYDLEIGSRDGFNKVLSSFNSADRNNFAPQGWSQWLRPGVKKVFIEITDDDSTMSAQAFDNALRGLSPQHFGTQSKRNYVWHGIFGLSPNSPAHQPYLPGAPLVQSRCTMWNRFRPYVASRAGVERQRLSRMTGGLRFSICRSNDYESLFDRLAADVIETVKVDCEFDLSDLDDLPDLASIAVEYSSNNGGSPELLLQVGEYSECDTNSFYLDGEELKLCPAACSRIQADSGANLSLSGCHAP